MRKLKLEIQETRKREKKVELVERKATKKYLETVRAKTSNSCSWRTTGRILNFIWTYLLSPPPNTETLNICGFNKAGEETKVRIFINAFRRRDTINYCLAGKIPKQSQASKPTVQQVKLFGQVRSVVMCIYVNAYIKINNKGKATEQKCWTKYQMNFGVSGPAPGQVRMKVMNLIGQLFGFNECEFGGPTRSFNNYYNEY